MEIFRQTVESDSLNDISLPESFIGKKVNVIIYPAIDEDAILSCEKRKKAIYDLVGIFSEYAKPGMREQEEAAWEEAVVENYARKKYGLD
ncbi:MAG: hypothetical protein FWB74_09585 [Defluviitaleaceae bacterium]|nr:hypothetical protein [Defluviitaleaceae bacterium]